MKIQPILLKSANLLIVMRVNLEAKQSNINKSHFNVKTRGESQNYIENSGTNPFSQSKMSGTLFEDRTPS